MPTAETPNKVFPGHIIRDADAAIAYYRALFGAELIARFSEPDGTDAYAKVELGNSRLCPREEIPEWGWISPSSPGGSPVLTQMELTDCDAVAENMISADAEVVIPIKDRPYGKREGRIRNPFGHLRILSQEVAK